MERTMAWYFDRGLERGALLLDASNLDWFEFPLFSNIREEIYRTLEETKEDMDWGYSYPGGKNKLRELIATHESFLETKVITKEDVLINGNGVTGVLNFLVQALVQEGRTNGKMDFLYPVPSYAGLLKSIEFYGMKPVFINTKRENDYCVNFNEVADGYTKNTAAIIITNPGNPSCNYIKEEDLRRIFDFARERDFYVILDAIFEEAPKTKPFNLNTFNLIQDFDKLIKIKGFSKDTPQLCDLRLGWSISKNKYINDTLLQLGEVTNFSNSTFLEALGIVEMQYRVWKDKSVVNEKTALYEQEKTNYHKKILEGLSQTIKYLKSQSLIDDVIIPSCGNILFFKFNSDQMRKLNVNTTHDLFVYILEKTNILVTPGHVFGIDENELWCRITISRNIEQLLNGLKRIVNTINDNINKSEDSIVLRK